MTITTLRARAALAAALILLVPLPAAAPPSAPARPPSPAAPLPDRSRLARSVSSEPTGAGCPTSGDDTDPLAVAAAVAVAAFCGTGPPAVLTGHGQQVWVQLRARLVPAAAAWVATEAFVDPRSSPVVVYVAVIRPPDPTPYPVLVTLFPRPTGRGWEVDDLALVESVSSSARAMLSP